MSKVVDKKECLRRNFSFVTHEIDAMELVDRLVESEAISLSDRARIVDIKSNIDKNSDLVNIILNSSSEYVLNAFLKSLEPKYKHVLDKLQEQALNRAAAVCAEALWRITSGLRRDADALREYAEELRGGPDAEALRPWALALNRAAAVPGWSTWEWSGGPDALWEYADGLRRGADALREYAEELQRGPVARARVVALREYAEELQRGPDARTRVVGAEGNRADPPALNRAAAVCAEALWKITSGLRRGADALRGYAEELRGGPDGAEGSSVDATDLRRTAYVCAAVSIEASGALKKVAGGILLSSDKCKDQEEQKDATEKLRQENKQLQIKLEDEEDATEKLRQENKELQNKLDRAAVTIEKLRQENKELKDKLANLSTFKTKEIEFRLSEEETVEDHIKDVEHTRDTSPLGQNDNTSSHQKCVPVRDFLLTHLPPCYQHVEMLSLIKSLADISVKIEVKDVDDKRKPFSDFPAQASMLDSIDTKIVPGVSYSEVKSASLMKPGNSSTLIDSQMDVNTSDIISSSHLLGSGKVDDVYIRTEADYGPCPCHKKCQEWGEIRVLTSAQLMYDDDDAKNFVCTFFYDDDDKRMDQLKSARGDRIVLRDLAKDVCMFLCVTCDVELVRTLEGMLNKFEQSWKNAFYKYANTVKWESERLTVIVFHPLGLKKHISVGRVLTSKYAHSEKTIQYDTPTCKGSTGAYVLIPDFDDKDDV